MPCETKMFPPPLAIQMRNVAKQKAAKLAAEVQAKKNKAAAKQEELLAESKRLSDTWAAEYTVAELRQMARKLAIVGRSKMGRDELTAAIEKAEGE